MKFWQLLDVEGAIHLFGRRQTLLSIEQCPDLGRDQESLKKDREVLWGCLENYFLVTDMVMQVKEYVNPSCHHCEALGNMSSIILVCYFYFPS